MVQGCKLRITKECPKCHMSGPCDCAIAAVVVTADGNWRDAHPDYSMKEQDTIMANLVQLLRNVQKLIQRFQILPYSTNNFHLIEKSNK